MCVLYRSELCGRGRLLITGVPWGVIPWYWSRLVLGTVLAYVPSCAGINDGVLPEACCNIADFPATTPMCSPFEGMVWDPWGWFRGATLPDSLLRWVDRLAVPTDDATAGGPFELCAEP